MQSVACSFRFVAVCLVSLLMADPVLAASPSVARAAAPKELGGDERILQALNRLTFGPRPGDVEAVKAIGLKAWFEAQLQPAGIDDAALEARLESFPAMKLSQQALMERFPSPQVLRVMEAQNLPFPSDPVEAALYADQMAFYKMAKANKAAVDGKTGAAQKNMDGTGADLAMPAPVSHEEQLYSGLEAVKILNLQPNARMSRIMAMSPQELIAFRRSLSPRELSELGEGLSPEQKEILVALPGSVRMVSGEVLQSRLLRDIYSERQLEAVMTDFWLNHFNVYIRKNQNEPFLLPAYERDVIRPNALGNFETLLVATAKSPAMLMYLDNWQSIGPGSQVAARGAERLLRNPDAKKAANGLNENYARELMELHTLGVNGGYTQADVTQVARVFTGWTIERPFRGAAYTFEANRHEPGAKQVLGATIAPNGEQEGLRVLHMLATSPATARFISTKLAIRFVADDPPPALVDRMARTFLAGNGDIKAVLRTMFDSPEFWSPEVYRAKVKTPLEFVVSAARATGAEVANAQPLVQSLDRLGMPLYGMQTPNGYSWKSEPWVSTGALVSRMNFALVLTGDKLQGIHTGLPQLLDSSDPFTAGVHPASFPAAGAEEDTLAKKERRLEFFLFGEPVSDRTRRTVLQQAEDSTAQQQAEKAFPIRATDPEQLANALPGGRMDMPKQLGAKPPVSGDLQAQTMAGLLLGSPEFQRR